MIYLSFRTKPSGACRMRRISRRNQSAFATMRGQGRGQSFFLIIYRYIIYVIICYIHVYIYNRDPKSTGPYFLERNSEVLWNLTLLQTSLSDVEWVNRVKGSSHGSPGSIERNGTMTRLKMPGGIFGVVHDARNHWLKALEKKCV